MSRKDNKLQHTARSWPGGMVVGPRLVPSIPVHFLAGEHRERIDGIPTVVEAFEGSLASLLLTSHLASKRELIALRFKRAEPLTRKLKRRPHQGHSRILAKSIDIFIVKDLNSANNHKFFSRDAIAKNRMFCRLGSSGI